MIKIWVAIISKTSHWGFIYLLNSISTYLKTQLYTVASILKFLPCLWIKVTLFFFFSNAFCINTEKPLALSGRKPPTNSLALFLQGSQIPGITVNLGWLSKKPGLHLLPCIPITSPEPKQKLLCHSGKWNNKFSVGLARQKQTANLNQKIFYFHHFIERALLFSFCFLSIHQ